MAFEQKDELYRVIVRDPKLPPEELAKHHKDLSTAETKLYVKAYVALDGAEIIVKKCPDGTYCIWDWTENADAQVRDAYYAIEQDRVFSAYFGAYCGDREGFERAWEEGWAIKTEITLAEDFFEIIEKL